MQNLPNDGQPARGGQALSEEPFIDPTFGQGRNKQEQSPENPADKTSPTWHDQPGDDADPQHNERGDAPAAVARTAQPHDAPEQDERGNESDEEEEMIEIDQGRAGRLSQGGLSIGQLRNFLFFQGCVR